MPRSERFFSRSRRGARRRATMQTHTTLTVLTGSLLVFAVGCSSSRAPSARTSPYVGGPVASVPSGTVRYLPAVSGKRRATEVIDATGLVGGSNQGKLLLSLPAAEAYARGIRASSAKSSLPEGSTLEVDLDVVRQDQRLGVTTLTSYATWTLKRDQSVVRKKITTRSAEERIELINGGLGEWPKPSGSAATEQLESMGAEAYREFLSFLSKRKPDQAAGPKDQR